MIKSRSIGFKTLFYLILFSVFILLLLWGTQLVLTDYLYEKYQIKDMNKIAMEISETDYDDLHENLSKIVYNNAVCIEYIDELGRKTLYNDASTGCLLGKNNKALLKQKRQLYDSGKEMNAVRLINPDYESSALLYGIEVEGGYVFLFTMLSNVNKNYNLVKDQLIYITIVVILLAIVLSIVLSKVFSEPIVKITEKSKLLAKGNYNVEFEKDGVKEIDELADTLNYLKSEVSKTDQYRRDLMANVSHDLKTPLTMIKAYAEMVRDITYKDKKKREENLNVIIDETDRLNLLVGDILSLSKLQSNSTTLEPEVFNLKDEIEGILRRYDYLKETEGYNIIAEVPDDVIVNADKNKINQVIYNLINNALNYTGDDKNVYIRVTDNKRNYLIEIIDTGKGIDKEDIEHIWDKYYKKEKNHKRNVIGTGLGLSIVKGILECHNMTYGVRSQKDKGSVFYFQIDKFNNKK